MMEGGSENKLDENGKVDFGRRKTRFTPRKENVILWANCKERNGTVFGFSK